MKTSYTILAIVGLSILSPSCNSSDDERPHGYPHKANSIDSIAFLPITTEPSGKLIDPISFCERSKNVSCPYGQHDASTTTEYDFGNHSSKTAEFNPTQDIVWPESFAEGKATFTGIPLKTDLPQAQAKVNISPSNTGDKRLTVYEPSSSTLAFCNISSTNAH